MEERKMSLKHPNRQSITKHDLIREIKELKMFMSGMYERILNVETIVSFYVEMNGDDKDFAKYLDKKAEEIAENKKEKSKGEHK
jgi:hypothetical protein